MWTDRQTDGRTDGQTDRQSDGRFDMSGLIASFVHAPRRLVKITEIKVEKMSDAKLHFRLSNSFKLRYVSEF
jgi:hypothetical protein